MEIIACRNIKRTIVKTVIESFADIRIVHIAILINNNTFHTFYLRCGNRLLLLIKCQLLPPTKSTQYLVKRISD